MNWSGRFATRTDKMRRSAIRELLKVISRPGMISFAGGLPAPELFPAAELRAAADRLLAERPRNALQYGETEGVPGLRDWIAGQASTPNRPLTRDNVIVTTGAQQGLDLLARVFSEPGSPVLVENPTYLAFLTAWGPFQPRFVPATSDADGLRVGDLESLPPSETRLLYTIPDFQNPSGATLSGPRRHELIEFSRARDLVILEDVAYRSLRFEGPELPSLLELDAAANGPTEQRVVQIGTFSKVLAPGLRVGWIVGPKEVIEKLVLAKQAMDLHTSTLTQHLAFELVRDGFLDTHIVKLRSVYRERRDAMVAAIREFLPPGTQFTPPQGGLFVFVHLPNGLLAQDLLKRAIEANVAFVPGAEFFCDGRGEHTLRLNFSHSAPEEIHAGMRRLSQCL
jgi:2-aminoadipate transaminase